MSADELEAMRERALAAGTAIAKRMFAKRGNHTEIHLRQAELAAALTVAFEHGFLTAASETGGTERKDGG